MKFPAAVLFVGLCCAPAYANDYAYSTDTNGNLWRIDFTSPSAALIGPTGTGSFLESIAQRSDGALFGASDFGALYRINTANGAATLIGSTGLGNIEALDFNGDTLVGVDFNNPPRIYQLNQSTAAPTLLATANLATGLVRSGAILDSNTMLIRGDAPGDTLYSVRISDGATTLIGNMGIPIYGMDFVGTKLYGVSDGGRLYSINPLTGASTQIGDVGEQFFLSLTAAQIPEPCSAILLLMAGVAGTGRARFRFANS